MTLTSDVQGVGLAESTSRTRMTADGLFFITKEAAATAKMIATPCNLETGRVGQKAFIITIV